MLAMAELKDDPKMQALVGSGVAEEADVDLRWHVLLTEPNGEMVAERALLRRGFKPYLPKEPKIVTYGVRSYFQSEPIKRKRLIQAPIFRGYLLIPLNMAWSFVRWNEVPGIRQQGCPFLRKADGSYRIADEEAMAKIRGIEHKLANPEIPGIPYKVGDRVRMLNGHLANYIAEIGKLDDRKRIQLLFDILGQKSKVYVTVDEITDA